MKKPPQMTEDERAELVAFLDGELTDDAARVIEARLNVEPAYRAEAKALERAWEMLDYLPKAEPTPNFSERTLTKVVPVMTRRMPPPLPARRRWWFWPAVAGGWAVAFFLTIALGYGAYSLIVPREPGQADLVRDLRLIENKKAYDNVEDFEFLRPMARLLI